MPLYEYQCDSCGARFELIRKFSDPPVTTCPACGAENLQKLVSSPAFQFKGTGWYVTDYAKKSGEAAPSGKTGDGKTDTKAETKPDAGSDTARASADKPAANAPAAPAAPAKDKQP
jgi:putative FmdB family regulatory protein